MASITGNMSEVLAVPLIHNVGGLSAEFTLCYISAHVYDFVNHMRRHSV